jgi:PHP family Zn ribbon phosphoesterase
MKNTQQTNLYHKSCHCGRYLEDGVKATLEELTTGVSKRPFEGVK